MANETTIGELSINLKMKLEGLEKGLETAQKKLQSIEQQNEQLKSSNNSLDASFIAMSATAVMALGKIKSAIDDGVEKYNSYVNSMNALQKTAKATNNSMTEIKDTMSDVNEFKFIDDADLSKSMQNLLRYGFTVEQASEMLKVMQDAAVGNREPQYTLSEAIKVTTDGIRMENSVLSNAVGVEKNISKMLEEHADKLGKTTDALTQAEKVQAVYNGFMDEAKDFTGSAAEMAETYQGQQAQLNAVNLEFSRTLGESMIPALTQYKSLQLLIIKGLTDFMKGYKGATSGVVTFTTAMLATVVAVTAVKKAIVSYTTATGVANATTKALTASVMANPLFIGGIVLSVGISAINAYSTSVQESIDKMEEATERSKTLVEAIENFRKNGTYTESEKSLVEEERNRAQEIVKVYEEKTNKIQELQGKIEAINSKGDWNTTYNEYQDLRKYKEELKNTQKELEDFSKEKIESGRTIDSYRQKIAALNVSLNANEATQKFLTLTNTKAQREQLINIAQTKADIDGKKQLLNILKQGKVGTEQYTNAKNQLVKVYPELAKVNENTIASTEKTLAEEEKAAQKEWDLAQKTIDNSVAELQAMAKNDERVQQIAISTKQKVEDVKGAIEAATQSLIVMSQIAPAELKNSVTTEFTPKTNTPSSSSGSYENKKLDNYKALIEHKKNMDQISTKQEIAMYEKALKSYAKTTEEKRELREKLHELNKELANKEKEMLEQQTEDYETYMEKQRNARGAAYDVKEQTKDYDKIIQMHQKYLKQIMKDERLSLEERKSIYREELATIREYEQQKRDLRVQAVDNTVNQLTNAITKQLEEMQKKDKEMIDANLKAVEEWKDARIEAINEEYDARIEAIEKELEALDKAEQQKTRDEEDAEYEKKKKRLEELVAFEHDAVSKANYQKELDKLVAEYQKTLDKRTLEDKKEALNAQKDLLKEEQDNKVQAVEEETEKQKEEYNKQLEQIEQYYEEQNNKAQETAEKMLLNVKKNQNQILNLLKNYGDKYEITGQTLGEKLAQGLNKGLSTNIEKAIQKFQDTIDANLEKKIKEWTSSSYKYKAGENKPEVKTVNVYQTNNIEQNPEMPSETYRKLNNVSQKLAEEFAGM